jgi:hypothetical protein
MSYGEDPLVVFGRENDGPVFTRACPSCGRFMKFPDRMKWSEDLTGLCKFEEVTCSRCGSVKPNHIGWASDFYD